MDREKFYELIIEILESEEFQKVRYYAYNLGRPLWNIFRQQWNGIPYFLRSICDKASYLIKKYKATPGAVMAYYSEDSNYLWVASKIKIIKPQSSLGETEILSKLMYGEDISEYIDTEEEKFICSLVCYVLDNNRLSSLDFNEVCKLEEFAYDITDYKLTKVDHVQFLPSGYIYDNKYYLYSIYISKEKLDFFDKKPAVFKIMEEEILNPDIYMRLDERIAVPHTDIISLETLNFEKFRGIQFNFSNTKLDKGKNIIVHGNIESFHKLLMVIKKDYDNTLDEEFWHIELEELPYLESTTIKRVTVTFIHGKYYPQRRFFRHIDYIKNQYPYDIYHEKYKDMTNTSIQIDHYTDKTNHYKIWCVEEADISEDTWFKLAYMSLKPVYRKLLNEMLGNNNK